MPRHRDDRRCTGQGPRAGAPGLPARTLGAALALLSAAATLLAPAGAAAQEEVRVVTTLPTYAAIAREVAGDRARVEAIARGDEDPHFVTPRPSHAAKLQRADLFVTTGLDLELWVPGLLDRAGNAGIVEGADGHVAAYDGIELLQVPENASRAGGDIHVFGNPHVHTDPVNGIRIARNIARGLERIDPAGRATYRERLRAFEDEVLERTFGAEMIRLLGRENLLTLALARKFWSFARGQVRQGEPLTEYLGGWLAEAAPFRDRRMVCYHKNWAYFSARFRVECAMYVEAKPGIPPSPGHVRDVIDFVRSESIPVVFGANYFSEKQVRRVAERTGARAVIVPEHVGGAEGVDDYFALVDLWVDRLAEAFGGPATAGEGEG